MSKRTLFTSTDIGLFGLGIILIGAGLYTHQTQFGDVYITNNNKEIGLHVIGDGLKKLSGNLFWQDIANNSKIYNGDKIFANSNEDIKVQLSNGDVEVTIPKDSLVVIKETDGVFEFSLGSGNISVKSKSAKETKIKIKNATSINKTLSLSKEAEVEIKQASKNLEINLNKGEAKVITGETRQLQLSEGSVYNLDNKSQVSKIQMTDLIEENSVNLIESKYVTVNNPVLEGQELVVSKSVSGKPVASAVVTDSKVDVSKLAPGSYFIKVPGSDNVDRFSVSAVNNLSPSVASSEIISGEYATIKWQGRKDLDYKVTVVDNNETKDYIVKGNKLSILPKSDEKIAISVAPILKKQIDKNTNLTGPNSLDSSDSSGLNISTSSLFVVDEVANQLQNDLKSSADAKISIGENAEVYSNSVAKLERVNTKDESVQVVNQNIKYSNSTTDLKISSTKEAMKKNGDKQQVSRTIFTQKDKTIETYERSNLSKAIPALKKAKVKSDDGEKEFIVRYDNEGRVASTTLREKGLVVDQAFQAGALATISVLKNGLKLSSAQAESFKMTDNIGNFISQEMALASSSAPVSAPSVEPRAIQSDVAPTEIKINKINPVKVANVFDKIDESDNYKKIVEIDKKVKKDFRYNLNSKDGKLVHSGKLISDNLEFKNLKEGNYDLEIIDPVTKVKVAKEVLDVKKRVEINPIVEDDINVEKKEFQIPLSWKSESDKVKLEVYRYFHKTPILTEEVNGNKYDFKTDDFKGLSFRVIPTNEKELPSVKKKITPPAVLSELPLDESIIMKYKNEAGGCYEFQLPVISNVDKYFVEVYEKKNLQKMVFNRWTTKPGICWQSNKHGKYFYRYKYFDKWGQQSSFSKVGEIIFPISPLTEF